MCNVKMHTNAKHNRTKPVKKNQRWSKKVFETPSQSLSTAMLIDWIVVCLERILRLQTMHQVD